MSFSKIGSPIEISVKEKLFEKSETKFKNVVDNGSKYFTFYHNGPTYFIRALSYMPNDIGNLQPSSHYKMVSFGNALKHSPTCVLNSSLFYFFYKNYSNCRDFSEREIYAFSIGEMTNELIEILNGLEIQLRISYQQNRELKSRVYDSGYIQYDEFYPAKSKVIIDEIDTALAAHYGFTDEELDFIINYDIKYRMGKELENEGD